MDKIYHNNNNLSSDGFHIYLHIPHNFTIEQKLIASLMKNIQLVGEVDLLEDDFFFDIHRSAFKVLGDFYAKGIFDFALVKQKLSEVLGGLKVEEYLGLAEENISVISSLVAEIRNLSIRRKILHGLLQIFEANDAGADVSFLQDKLFEIAKGLTSFTRDEINMCYLYQDLKEFLEGMKKGRGVEPTINILGLEKKLYTLEPGYLIVIGARPGIGKSALSINLALNFASQHIPVGIIHFEMDENQVRRRLVSILTGVNISKLRKKSLTEEEKQILSALEGFVDQYIAGAEVEGFYGSVLKNLVNVYSRSNSYLNHVKRVVRYLVEKAQVKVVFIDYLQRIQVFGKEKDPLWDVMRVVVSELKTLAVELGITIFALAQLNRDVERRSDKTPQLSDLRDSGWIEQEADVVIFLHYPEKRRRKNKEAKEAEVEEGPYREIIASFSKNREGELGSVRLWMQVATTKLIRDDEYQDLQISKKETEEKETTEETEEETSFDDFDAIYDS